VHGAVKKTLQEPTVRTRIEETGSIVIANTPEEFADQIKAEYEVYRKVVDEKQLKPE
jgi:tripartite-type tricarboxylate transporter receptor subunit TctC